MFELSQVSLAESQALYQGKTVEVRRRRVLPAESGQKGKVETATPLRPHVKKGFACVR
jgi:hypothetical protein